MRAIRRIIRRWGRRVLWVFVLWLAYAWFIGSEAFRSTFLTYLFYAAFIIFWTGGQIFMFIYFMARTRQETFLPGQAGLPTLDDYWGQPKIVETVRQWVALLSGVQRFHQIGGQPPTGLLLYGPPGSGKTFLAKAIAGSAGIPLAYMDASSLQSAWFGIGNVKVIQLYRRAKKLAIDYGTCAVYFDEIDAIGGARSVAPAAQRWPGSGRGPLSVLMGGMGGGGSMLLSTLLHELDGSAETFLLERIRNRVLGWLGLAAPPRDWHVFTFGSTNIPEVLDPALLRSGRLSRKLHVDRPDRAGRREILAGYLRQIRAAPNIDVDTLTDELAEATPADVRSLVLEEAPRKAVFEGADQVGMRHFLAALREVQVGLRNPIADLDPKEREKIAVHEAGHALLVWLLTDKRLSTVTVVRYGDSLGHVLPVETRQRAIRSLNESWVEAIISIGGRAAEIATYGEPLNSVGGDYASVMGQLHQLLMSGLWGTPFGTERETSLRVRHLFDEALQEAARIIREHRGLHTTLVEALVQRDELGHDEAAALLGERPRITVSNPVEPEILRRVANGRRAT